MSHQDNRREPSGPHESRKLVTVLFSDLEESTAVWEQLDTELLRALLTEYFETMSAVVEHWGGSVQKYIGDAVVAVFGIPRTREEDAVRAIRAGLQMQQRLAELNPELQERYGVELAMRVAINTGEVLASTDAEAVIAGDVFNIAARLQAAAQSGVVIVGERTHRAAQAAFDFESLGQIELKGRSEPQPAWQVTGVRLAAEPSSETEMVGREAELGMLTTLMEQTIDSAQPRLVIIVGEAGIGKSRLVREFVAGQSERIRSLLGRCLPYGQGITFWPLREVLWEAAGITLDDSAGAAAEKLRDLVGRLARGTTVEPDWLSYALAATAGISMPDNPFDRLSPESAGEELQLAWPAFASVLASDQPTVLVVEDIHWAEEPLLDMIEQLALRAQGPLLVAATVRPEFMTTRVGWGARSIPSQISLGPLLEASFDRFIAQLLPDADPDLRHALLDSAGGNPFFAQEMARRAREEDLDKLAGTPILVPDTARAVLAARLDRLDSSDQEVLQDAAVIGEVFWPASLAELRGRDVSDALATLERSGFITVQPGTSLPGERELTFRHSLMREVVYQSIARRRLAPAHAAVAEWTEKMAPDRREEFIDLVAHHYAEAAQPERASLAWRDDPERADQVRARAVAALVEAGTAARRRFSIDQAVRYADRALALAATDVERLAALELKAASYHAAARVDEAFPVYLEAIEAARSVGDEADISRVITQSTLLWGRYAGAFTTEDWKPQALEIVSNRLAEVGEGSESLEVAALLAGRAGLGRRQVFPRTLEESKADAQRAVEISEKLGSEELLSHALDTLEMCLREEGLCGLGDLADRMVKLASDMVDRRQAHEMLITSAVALAQIGRFQESREVGAMAHADATGMGIHQRIHGVSALTAHMGPLGHFAEIVEATGDVPQLLVEDGGNICDFGAAALILRTLALFERGEAKTAREIVALFREARSDITRNLLPEYQMVERVRPFIGLEEATRMLSDAGEPSRPAQHLHWVRARLPIAVLSEDWTEAATLSEQARRMAEPCCDPQLLALAGWADAARSGSVADAAAARTGFWEPYTAARLGVDFLATVDVSEGEEMRSEVAGTLESMGARESLNQLLAS